MPRADVGPAVGPGLLWAFPTMTMLGARATFSYLETSFVLPRFFGITKAAQSKANHAILKNSLDDKQEGGCPASNFDRGIGGSPWQGAEDRAADPLALPSGHLCSRSLHPAVLGELP